MTLQNVRLQALYKGFAIGNNGLVQGAVNQIGAASAQYFIDSSNRKVAFERRGGRFRFACDVVVLAQDNATQASFNQACTDLETAFDPKASPNGSLRIESDNQTYENFDRVTVASFTLRNNGNLVNGNAFTVTVNGVPYTVTAGVNFAIGATLLATAQNLMVALVTSGAPVSVWLGRPNGLPGFLSVYFQSRNTTYSLTVTTTANIFGANAYPNTTAQMVATGFNAVPSISKIGSEDDTALSRRYAIEVVLDLPHTEANKNGRRETLIEVSETAEMGDSRRQQLKISGVYTALTFRAALAQYDASIDAFALSTQKALGGAWEGPFDVIARPDAEYVFPEDGTRSIGAVLRFSRTYDELIYKRGLGDDVRLRRQKLLVKFATEAPGDYGPNGKQVFRLRRATISYAAGVDKNATQDLVTVWKSVVKPLLIDEAKKAFGTGSIALTFQEPELDRVKNRIAATVQVLGASNGTIVESSVMTQDKLNAGLHLVHVWDDVGDGMGKQRYDGPKVLTRTVKQTFKVLQGPSAAAGSQAGGGGGSSFGIGAINKPTAFVLITESSAAEAAIDSFFGIDTGSGGGGSGRLGGADDEPGFPVSGGVPEPKFTRAFLDGEIMIIPNVLGAAGDPQLRVTLVVKTKSYQYYRPTTLPEPPKPKTPSPGGAAQKPGKSTTGGGRDAGAPTP